MIQKILGAEGYYCIDTSALIELKQHYFQNIFVTLWENLEKLVLNGCLIAPREVFNELEKYADKNDELLKWTKKHKVMFKDLDNDQLQQVQIILKEFPHLIDPNKTTPDADPFIIALALKGYTVVTQEKMANPGGKPKIPNVCEKYGVKCGSLYEFFVEQGWRF